MSWRLPREETKTKIGRVIVDYEYSPEETSGVLDAVADTWPERYSVKYLITRGGFIDREWLEDVAVAPSDVANPSRSLIDKLQSVAKRKVTQILASASLDFSPEMNNGKRSK